MYKVILLILLLLPSAFIYSWQGMDPTRPLIPGGTSATQNTNGGMVLQSIIRQQGITKAVINGKVVSVGDTLDDYQVTAISARAVMLKSAQQQLKLSLFSGAVIQE